MKRGWILLLTVATLAVAGCRSTAPAPEVAAPPAVEMEEIVLRSGWTPSEIEMALGGSDPIEGFNRSMFACTDFLMNWVVDPLGRIYTTILPRPVIEAVDNACLNLEYPGRLFSCLLRAEWRGSWDETVRFFVNTTVGIGGLFDPAAAWWDFYSTESDFGQTFAAWGIGPGCTLVLPLSRAINVRDTVGSIFDMAFDAKTYIPFAGSATALNRAVVAQRSYVQVVEGSADPYKTYRELMLVQRELQLRMWSYHRKNEAAELRKKALPPPEFDYSVAPKPEGVAGNWEAIPGYGAQSPFLDTLRASLFRARQDDDYWYFRLSFFNSDFAKRSSYRKIEIDPELPKLRYNFWEAPEPEEKLSEALREKMPQKLALILPGIGGLHTSASVVGLAELLNRQGYAVAAVDSVFTWQYTESGGRRNLPGYLPQDAENLRRVLWLVLDDLRDAGLVTRPWTVLTGYSFGGIHTLKIAELEEKQNTLDIQRFVAINPPADLEYAIRMADSLALSGSRWTRGEMVEHLVETAGRQMAWMSQKYPFYNPERPEPILDYRSPLGEQEARYLVALSFRMSLRELLMVAHRRGGVPFKSESSWFNRNELYREIDQVNFRTYAEKFVAPQHPELPLEELYRSSNLRSLTETLRNNPKVRILHNYDDFLLSPDDRKFLDETLGPKITWFNRGAHLGNFYVTTFQQRLLEELSGPSEPLLKPVPPAEDRDPE